MIKEPLFQPDITDALIRNFKFFFFEKDWVFYAAFLLIFFGVSFWALMRKNQVSYAGLFPTEVFKFDIKDKNHRIGLYFCFFVLLIYTAVMYLLENSLFNNHDLMSYNTTLIFLNGQISAYDKDRFTPLAFWDNNLVYAITHNYNLINVWMLAKQILIAFLLYRFLDFISVGKRLFGIGIILFLPALFWINNIIFPEQNMLIFMIASLMAIKKFSLTGKKRYLAWFVFFMNLAIYSKESAILFYGGIFVTSLLYNVFIEKINLSSFLHPFKSIKQMPLEFLMFLSMLFFSTFYMAITEKADQNRYVLMGQSNISELLALYKIELSLAIMAMIVFIVRTVQKRIKTNPMFNDGLMFGALFVIGGIVFYFRLLPISTHVYFKSYYLVIAAIFLSVYLLINISVKKEIFLGGILLLMVSSWTNVDNFSREQGGWYREAIEYLVSNAQEEKTLNIFLAKHIEYNLWTVEAWSSALRYYFPQYKIVIKSPLIEKESEKAYQRNDFIFHPLLHEEELSVGDYYVLKKNYFWRKDLDAIAHKKSLMVYENEAFQIFKILP